MVSRPRCSVATPAGAIARITAYRGSCRSTAHFLRALMRGRRGIVTNIPADRAERRDTMTPLQTAAARLIALVKAALADPSVARSAIARAAVELMDCTARPSKDDDPAIVYMADQFAEKAALWAYGQRDRDFRRADDEIKLRNALRAY
jgi:hypothetical protein